MRRVLIFTLMLAAATASAQDTGWVVTTDYSAFGRMRDFATAAPWTVSGDLATIPGDAVARRHDGLLYVVGRGGANLLQVYDPAAGFALVHEFSLGDGLNPQDIAFDAAGTAWVSCYDQAVLLEVDVAAETVTAGYSTAAYADADGIPETGWMRMTGDKLLITCQLLDRNNWYAPTGPGLLLVFDTATKSFTDPIALAGANPYTQIDRDPDIGTLYVGCAGYFGLTDGGVEMVDPVAEASLGYAATEAQLGGDVTGLAWTGGGVLHVLVSDASYITSLRRWDTATSTLTVLDTGSGYVHADVAWDGGAQLFLADRTAAAAGLRVFDAQSGAELTAGTIPTGLPPFMIVLPRADGASPVPGVTGTGSLAMSAPWPNPANPAVTVALSGKPGAAAAVRVYDLRGRRVWEGAVALDTTGHADWTFTGRDQRGLPLAAGVYRLAAQTGSGFAVRTVTIVK